MKIVWGLCFSENKVVRWHAFRIHEVHEKKDDIIQMLTQVSVCGLMQNTNIDGDTYEEAQEIQDSEDKIYKICKLCSSKVKKLKFLNKN